MLMLQACAPPQLPCFPSSADVAGSALAKSHKLKDKLADAKVRARHAFHNFRAYSGYNFSAIFYVFAYGIDANKNAGKN